MNLSSLKLSPLFEFSLSIFLLLACTNHASGQDNANQNANANANTNSTSNANKNTANTNNQNTNTNQTTTTTTPPTRNAIPCPSPDVFNAVNVTNAFKSGTQTQTAPGGVKDVELGDEITVVLSDLKTLLDRAKCTAPVKNVVLYLDGRPMKELTPYPPTDPAKNTLSFQLKRTEKSRDVWTHILGEPRFELRERAVSVGIEDEYPVPSTATLKLQTIPLWWFIFWVILFVLIFILFWVLAKATNLLRDDGPEPGPGERRPYSLARTQAAWWFFIVLASYLFIGMITGDFSTTITGTVLTLLGISAGTIVGSLFVDASKPTAPSAAVTSPPTAAAVRGTTTWKNEWWWLDILSDAQGVSFHRFQMAAWTLVLGIIFVVQVYSALAMPDFNGSLLALLGISAGTFLGAKIPEPTAPKS
jgi:hypothetical protein